MAKGVEDTAFYRYLRLLALNDVGGDPGRFGISVDDFHAANAERAAYRSTCSSPRPTTPSARATCGRGSARSPAWPRSGRRTCAAGSRCSRAVPGPDAAERYLVFQTLVGAWPIEPERLDGYLEKALREAKRTTSWIEPDEEHEAAVKAFARGLSDLPEFRADFDPFAAEVAAAGRARGARPARCSSSPSPGCRTSTTATSCRCSRSSTPTTGAPVDWDARREALAALRRGEDSDPKLLLIVRALELRARRPERVLRRLHAASARARGLRVRARRGRGARRGAGAPAAGRDLALPGELAGAWRDVLTGARRELSRRTQVTELTSAHGFALLERD